VDCVEDRVEADCVEYCLEDYVEYCVEEQPAVQPQVEPVTGYSDPVMLDNPMISPAEHQTEHQTESQTESQTELVVQDDLDEPSAHFFKGPAPLILALRRGRYATTFITNYLSVGHIIY
jgi:hypothetical protein